MVSRAVFRAAPTVPVLSHSLVTAQELAPKKKAVLNQIREAAQESRERTERAVKQAKAVGGTANITKRDYPTLVELKVAGRSDKQIAERMNSSLKVVRLHVSRAMAEYRNGDIRIREGEAVQEARKVGKEKGERFAKDLGTPISATNIGTNSAELSQASADVSVQAGISVIA